MKKTTGRIIAIASLFIIVSSFQVPSSRAGYGTVRNIDKRSTSVLFTTTSSFQRRPSEDLFSTFSADDDKKITPAATGIATFSDAGCTVPSTDFELGATVCVKITTPTTNSRFRWTNANGDSYQIDPGGTIRADGATQLFTLPSSATSASPLGGPVSDNRGTWRVQAVGSNNNTASATQNFYVHQSGTPVANLNISASSSASAGGPPGTPFTYSFLVNNVGPDAATNAVLTATVPTNTTFVSMIPAAGVSGWSCSGLQPGGIVTCTNPSFAAPSPGTTDQKQFDLIVMVPATASTNTYFTSVGTIFSAVHDPKLANNTGVAPAFVNPGGAAGPSLRPNPPVMLTAEDCGSPDGIIEPGETVTISLCVGNATGGAATSNLIGSLQETGGVGHVLSGQQSYGAISGGGADVCKTFSFTAANVECGSVLVPSLDLIDGATIRGTLVFSGLGISPLIMATNVGAGNTAVATCCAPAVNSTTTITNATPSSPSAFGQQVTFTATVAPSNTPLATGVVTFKDGAATLGTGNLSNIGGVATATFTTNATQLAVGGHTVTAQYGGDSNYNASTSAGFPFTVGNAATVTTVTNVSPASPSTFGAAVQFTATVGPNQGATLPTGTVTFKDGEATLGNGTLSNVGGVATATFTTSGTQLPGGAHTITAVYGGDSNFNGSSSANFAYTVNGTNTVTAVTNAIPASPSTFGTALQFTATVTPNQGTVLPTGNVTFKDGATTLGTGTLANVGNVATASFTTSGTQLTGGAHTITAVYGGDTNYNSSTSVNFAYTVNRAASVTTFTNASPGSPSTFGTVVQFTATVTPNQGSVLPTGTVTFKDGAATLGTGTLANVGNVATATFTTGSAQLTTGAHTITAVYGADTNYNGSSSGNFAYTVNTAATVTTITNASPASPSTFGTPVQFTATVTPNQGGVLPTGNVTFKDGATTLGTGTLSNVGGTATANYTTTGSQLVIGNHTITASYGGDSTYASSTSAGFPFTVGNAATVTTVTNASPASPSTFGAAVQFTATVGPNQGGTLPTGTVTFKDGAAILGNGALSNVGGVATATFTTSATQLTGGAHAITAVYGGDASFGGSTSANFGYTVNPANTVTTVANASPVSPSTFGAAVQFTATVTPNQGPVLPTGTVTFRDGATTLGTGTLSNVGNVATATFTTSASQLGGGAHTITAAYGGNNNYNTSTSGNFAYTVNRAITATAVTSSTNPSSPGQSVTFTANVSSSAGTPTGTVQFKIDGANAAAPVTLNGAGNASTSTSSLTVAGSPHVISADYNGDSNFSASIGTLTGGQTITNTPLLRFSSATYTVSESAGFLTVSVNRTGDTSTAVNIDYATSDAGAPTLCTPSGGNTLASSRCDFESALGTLQFAPSEVSKTFVVLINRDSFVEGSEVFSVVLSNPTGGAVLSTPSKGDVTITDDNAGLPANAIDDTVAFVTQQYHDFLNRQPDSAGLAFWVDNINQCNDNARRPPGMTIPQCIEVMRINTSAAFFLSIEFQNSGMLVRSFYVAALDRPATNGMPNYAEFERDTQAVQRGVIVDPNNNGWQTVLANNRDAFMKDFVARPEFVGLYPTVDSPTIYVNKIYQHALSRPPTTAELNAAVAEFPSGASQASDLTGRARALLRVTLALDFQSREMNRAFVHMQYLGYLRRNPNDLPDSDFSGYDFWLAKLNSFNGNFINAEMVKAFLSSIEYRNRFGP